MVYSIVILGLVLLLWPIAAMVRRHYGRKLELNGQERRWRRMVRLVCLLDGVFVAGFLVILSVADDLTLLSGKLDPWVLIAQVIGLLGAAGTLLVLYAAVCTWRDPKLWRWTKLFNLLILLACLGFTWFVVHWNLINFNMHY